MRHSLQRQGTSVLKTVGSLRCESISRLGISSYTTGASSAQEYDVVIVGGGMVGSSLACSLASGPLTRNLRIALIEENKQHHLSKDQLPSFPDLRVSSINPISQRLLQDIGAWEHLPQDRVAPFDSMRVWESDGPASISFNSREMGEACMGYMVENNMLVDSLFRRMETLAPTITLYFPASITSIDLPEDSSNQKQQPSRSYEWSDGCPWVTLTLNSDRNIRTRLIVAADGKHSFVRKKAHVPTLSWNYQQRAVVASVELEQPTTTAWQRFLPSGPVALLPMFDNYASVVWSTTPQHAKHLVSIEPSEFIQQLNNALTAPSAGPPEWVRPFLSSIVPAPPKPPLATGLPSRRAFFPLGLSSALHYTRPRTALIGDAAHTIHPLAGQGVNLGFGDVISLTKAIAEGVEGGSDVGDVTLLSKYEQDRKWRNATMSAGVDGLKRLFDSRILPIAALRGLGLQITDSIPLIKRQIFGYASGGL